MGIIAPPGYPKITSVFSAIKASSKATEPDTSTVSVLADLANSFCAISIILSLNFVPRPTHVQRIITIYSSSVTQPSLAFFTCLKYLNNTPLLTGGSG